MLSAAGKGVKGKCLRKAAEEGVSLNRLISARLSGA
jgi:hypothetical protein